MSKSNQPECLRCRVPTKKEAIAFKQLHKGEADAYEQQIALKYIVDILARTHDMLYIPDSPEQTILSGS